jgi:hypothetical protein
MSASDSSVRSEWIDEAAVATLAHAAGFALAPEALAGIAVQLRRAYLIAAPLLTVDLDEHVEPGPVWRP